VHVDFMAIAFAHGMFWNLMRAFELKQPRYFVFGAILAGGAFLVKAPYAFYFALPLLYWIKKHRSWKQLLVYLPLFLIPVLVFGWWIWHTKEVNGAAPNWRPILPDYHRFTDMSTWYFGTWAQRITPQSWITLFERLWQEVLGISGLLLLVVGLFITRKKRGYAMAVWWIVGSLLYVLIFFNLNVQHNYYQLPLLAPAAVFMALGIERLSQKTKGSVRKIAFVVLLLLPITEGVFNAEMRYYSVPADQVAIAQALREHTSSNDLIVISYGGFDSRCPVLLYRAKRKGWSVHHLLLEPKVCYGLFKEGGDYLAIVSPVAPSGEMEEFTKVFPDHQIIDLGLGDTKMYLYKMEAQYLQPNQ